MLQFKCRLAYHKEPFKRAVAEIKTSLSAPIEGNQQLDNELNEAADKIGLLGDCDWLSLSVQYYPDKVIGHAGCYISHKARTLKGYYGGSQGQSAEIIVSGRTIQARADIGFKWNQSNGVYDVIHDSYETVPRLGQDFFTHKLMLAYGKRMVRAKAAEFQEQFGECAFAESTNGTVQTLRLTFAGHQEVKQYQRR